MCLNFKAANFLVPQVAQRLCRAFGVIILMPATADRLKAGQAYIVIHMWAGMMQCQTEQEALEKFLGGGVLLEGGQ